MTYGNNRPQVFFFIRFGFVRTIWKEVNNNLTGILCLKKVSQHKHTDSLTINEKSITKMKAKHKLSPSLFVSYLA